jgi:catechol 2,3-dioxygenase-like lactoylglutathione lyase family enzyme
MSPAPRPRAVAIVPCADLDAAEAWWNALGFRRPAGQDYPGYRMLDDGEGCEVHLSACPPGWVEAARNPFGVYLYTPRVDAIAATAAAHVIGPPSEAKPWGLREVALHGPDGLLVRVGWPLGAAEV